MMTGEKLYLLYLSTSESLWAPKWDDLDERSKGQWNNLAAKVFAEVYDYATRLRWVGVYGSEIKP